jgi:hypothetical protein
MSSSGANEQQGGCDFVVESAPGVNGPWETVPEPWLRTNATQIQMSVSTPDSMRLFRLRFAP